jgi:hypothetical protein
VKNDTAAAARLSSIDIVLQQPARTPNPSADEARPDPTIGPTSLLETDLLNPVYTQSQKNRHQPRRQWSIISIREAFSCPRE